MSKNKTKHETTGELNIEEPVENPLEERVANLEQMLQQSVAITNNLITYCNTVEKWRKMDFVPPKKDGEEDEAPTGDTETPAVVEETEEPVAA